MKNCEIHGYNPMQICDCHIHSHVQRPLNETIETYRSIKEHFNYEKFSINCLPIANHNIIDNYVGLYCKDIIGGVYVNTGIVHTFTFDESSGYYLNEIKKYHKMGADGMKMLDGKPDQRKALGKPLDHKDFDAYYAYAEENRIPIIMHWGDPREFWDPEKIPDWALERGWLYDSSFVPFLEARAEVERILAKFPKLKLTLAHFFFMSDEFEYAEEFLSKWKNVCVDLTPGSEMYKNFNANSEKWKDFFIRYSDKILYGTDIYNWDSNEKTVEERYSHAVNLERSFLEKSAPFTDAWTQHYFDKPFGLDEAILDKIYNKNFKRIWGENPKALDKEFIHFNCKEFAKNYDLPAEKIANLQQITEHFSK